MKEIEVLTYQYNLLKGSRNVLLDFCESMNEEALLHEFENFGRGCIRNLLVHIANTYRFWLVDFVEKIKSEYVPAESFSDINKIKNYFGNTDKLIFSFLDKFQSDFQKPLIGFAIGKEISASPLKLFTHVVTHEYHHKGQILSMGRHLGYTPPDTDALR